MRVGADDAGAMVFCRSGVAAAITFGASAHAVELAFMNAIAPEPG